MKRIDIVPRKDWEKSVEADGLVWHTANGVPYWDESAYYSFTLQQVEEIEKATNNCNMLMLEAAQYVLDKKLLHMFGIPDYCFDAIQYAWDTDVPALNYGRYDFGYDGINPPKLFEYNCDTPTSLLEAAIVQWNWKEDRFPNHDQFNSIHESLVNSWRRVAPHLNEQFVHFAYVEDDAGEDILNVAYMRDVAKEVGLETIPILMKDIGYNTKKNEFQDLNNVEMEVIYKLYPWEWLMNEEIGKHILRVGDETQWLEPIWKMIWSNKAILPILWEIAPFHENLLGATFKLRSGCYDYVKKPILSREGANVELVKDGKALVKTEGKYSTEACIFQEMFAIPDFGGGRYPIIGSWSVAGEPCGMGIREDGLITGNTARFIPHIIEG